MRMDKQTALETMSDVIISGICLKLEKENVKAIHGYVHEDGTVERWLRHGFYGLVYADDGNMYATEIDVLHENCNLDYKLDIVPYAVTIQENLNRVLRGESSPKYRTVDELKTAITCLTE